MNCDSNTVLDEINTLFKQKKYDEVINKTKILLDEGNNQISTEARTKLGLSYYYKGEFHKSLPIFEELASMNNDVLDWFNVMTSAIPIKEIEKGRAAFQKAIELRRISSDYGLPSTPFIRYYYALALNNAGIFDEAMEQLDVLKGFYIQLVDTDSNHLYVHGVPLLGQTLDLAKEVLTGLNIDMSRSEWLKELKQGIDDDGKNFIEKKYENANL